MCIPTEIGLGYRPSTLARKLGHSDSYHLVVYSGTLVCAFDLKHHSSILKHCSRISEQSKSNRPTEFGSNGLELIN